MKTVKMLGRIIVQCDIEVITGLHIGGTGGNLEIGGIDNPIIRDPLTMEPYIPGSSLRGKMRSQLEKKLGSLQNSEGKVSIHQCMGDAAENPCPVCRIFGISARDNIGVPTRLIVRDVRLNAASVSNLENANADLLFAEIKTEVTIDRVTAMANPRSMERVPAGAVFSPAEMVYTLFQQNDLEIFETVLDCLQMVEDDSLGGGGSRGNGKVRFTNFKIMFRSADLYADLHSVGEFPSLKAFREDNSALIKRCMEFMKGD